ncbi:Inositol-pentakisphosphate 2-kinase [Smittium culicis]|uniref:Inositol-pentakisphosphate 2-kinase n=1 Tax=Smittium culicis TaxID=133412 RepID=A0A1R1YG14_9FUNG|nr:Inositol-pentakisphosphate 2-kinase [Smittium culicis]
MSKMNYNDFEYKCEGNANLVVKYSGSDHNLKGSLLRLEKTGIDSKIPDEENPNFPRQINKGLYHDAIRDLVGIEHIFSIKKIETSSKFLDDISKKVDPKRPIFRKNKTRIDTNKSTAFITKDATEPIQGFDAYSVEFKVFIQKLFTWQHKIIREHK